MAFISAGYDGTVDEVQFAGMLPKAGTSEYGVAGAGDFAVTAVAGQDRTVSIAPGTAWGHSVTDVMDINDTLALTAPTSGSRWDMICLRRDWQPPGGATTISVVEGGASATTIPARLNNPGVLDEQPLYLARVDAGSTTIGYLIDLRCWGRNGGVTAKDSRALQYLAAIGSTVEIGGTTFQRLLDPNGTPYWAKTTRHDDTGWVDGNVGNGWTAVYFIYRKLGNLVEVKFRGSYNKEIGTDTNSNISNISFGSIPTSVAPTGPSTALASAATGPLAAGAVGSNGDCALTSIAPGAKFPAGYQFSFTGMFFSD